MKALVTGATGFVGRRLLAHLNRPVVLTRDVERAKRTLDGGSAECHAWDSSASEPPAAAFEGVDTVFHLAGDSLADGRWTAAKKRRIRESRALRTALLAQTIAKLDRKPAVLVSASAVGIYGSRGDETLDESSSLGGDFLAEVCTAWENAAAPAAAAGVRVVHPRIGVVLGQGGALKKMLLPFKLGLGGRLGNGRQWMSWIHLDDLVGLLLHAAGHGEVAGPMNGVAPNPVSNREFTRALAAALHRPAVMPVPYLGLRLAFGEFAKVLFDSQRVVPRAAQRSGYIFQYPTIDLAFGQIFGSRQGTASR